MCANRNKESVALDLKDDGDAAAVLELVSRADVLIENFRPGALARMGLAAETLLERNPRLVILSITGFGHDGPEAHRPGYDQIAQGETGLMSLTGSGPDDPQRVGVPICDLLAGINGVTGVLAALFERERTGRGQIVRTSLLAAGISVHAFQGSRWTVGGELGRANGNHHPTIAPYGAFRCADGAIQVAVGSQTLWQKFSVELGIGVDDLRFTRNTDRVAHRRQLIDLIEKAFADRTRGDLLKTLGGLGIPAGIIRTLDEVYSWEQVRSQKLLTELKDESGRRFSLPGPPLRFFDEAGVERPVAAHRAPPSLNDSGEAVRVWLAEGSHGTHES
jgi:crotonobetainyl-CoA:carnitine CoA-transferase CaiB-like acyl-CoA transferase